MKKKHRPRVYNIHHGDAPPDAVNIMRPGPYGNPYRIGRDGNRSKCIRKLGVFLDENPAVKAQIAKELRGRDLVCCCKPKPCHGDLYLEIANPGLKRTRTHLPKSKSQGILI